MAGMEPYWLGQYRQLLQRYLAPQRGAVLLMGGLTWAPLIFRSRGLLALGATCLVVSHRRAVLERADQILVLEDGRITARGRLAELLRTSWDGS